MPAVKAHIAISEKPIPEGSTVIALCGASVPNMKALQIYDRQTGKHEGNFWRGGCRKCTTADSESKRYEYQIVNGQELKHGEGT